MNMSIDGTDCRIQEPTPFDSKWYSHKFRGPGLRYEIGVSIDEGNIIWANGPFQCGSWPDVVIFRSQLKQRLLPDEKVLADRGYGDAKCVYEIPGRGARYSSLLRARHETLNGRLKNFAILRGCFRHPLERHVDCFYAIVNLCQLTICTGDKLFEIA